MTQAGLCFKNKFGFCKFNERCKFRHVTLVCEDDKWDVLNVRKDTQKHAGILEIIRGVNLQ